MENESYFIAIQYLESENETDVPMCQHPGCTRPAMECILDDITGHQTKEVILYYCISHANKYGFCWGCGIFIEGIYNELCENCRDEINELDDLMM